METGEIEQNAIQMTYRTDANNIFFTVWGGIGTSQLVTIYLDVILAMQVDRGCNLDSVGCDNADTEIRRRSVSKIRHVKTIYVSNTKQCLRET